MRVNNENQNRIIENQNEIIRGMKESAAKEKEQKQKYLYWFLTCVGGVLISALLSLIIV